MRGEILNALDEVTTVSKREAMALTGLSETHLTRYLQAGVITAWKLPSLTGPHSRGEWLVLRQSAEAVFLSKSMGGIN